MKGLKLSHEFNYTSSSGIGLARAIQLAVCPVIWERSVSRMRNYFTRHKIDNLGRNFGNDKDPSNGYMAWLNWGGDPGEKWVSNLKSNPAPGYQSWQWTKQDWRSVIVKGAKIDYSKKCGAKGTQLPDKSPRLCLPLYVLDTLSKTAKGRKIIREQARKKEKAKRGQRVPWHPEIKRLHNKLEKTIPEDDPKLRKNPKFKVGGKIREGKRKGKVHAIHSKGTVDVIFEDMDYPVRRQYHQVMRANPAIKVEDYDPALAQYHAQVQGIYESLVRKSMGARSSVPFKNARGKRMDASFSREKVRDLLNNAFNIAVGVGRKEGTLAKVGLKPTALGRKKSRTRLDDYPKWWENLIDYEMTLSKARMVPYRVLVVQEKGRKKYYAMPLGAKYSTKRDAVAEAEQLNEQVRKRVKRRTRTKRRQPRPDRYFVKASKSPSGPFRRVGVFTRKREAIQEAKKVVNDGRYKASLVEARYRHGRALLVDLDTGEITDQRLG